MSGIPTIPAPPLRGARRFPLTTILEEAQEILGPPLKIEGHRSWAIWWCPFHPDDDRAGKGGHPNFGIHTEKGYWKCLRCGAKGPSLKVLRKRLGKNLPPIHPAIPTRRETRPQIAQLKEALAENRAALMRSPGWEYLHQRGIRPYTALLYGLGYGLVQPPVSQTVCMAARKSGLIARSGKWLWAGGIVYADPPTEPRVVQVRHLPAKPKKKYQTWGRLTIPLGAWRIKPSTLVLVVVEGMFDAFALAQALHDREHTHAVALFTGGATPSYPMLTWFATHARKYGFVLIPDPDEAGQQWNHTLQGVVQGAGGVALTHQTPEGLDPDEAILQGWWPAGI